MAARSARKVNPIFAVIIAALAMVLITVIVFLALGYRYTSENGIKFLGKVENGQPQTGSLNYPADNVDGSLDKPNKTIRFDDGSVYVGDIDYLQRDGYGEMTFAGGDKYVGEWKNDKIHGNGTFTYANGDVYVGSFENGIPNGYGVTTFANGNIYEGNYKNGMRHGDGKFTLVDGSVYEGQYYKDMRHGEGTQTKTFEGGAKEVYEGAWLNDKRDDDYATLTYSNGDEYTGPFINNLPDTRAKDDDGKFVTDADGNYVHAGRGLYTHADGQQYTGYFEAGKIVTYDEDVDVE